MPISLIIVLLVSAVAHTTWNLLLKQATQRYLIICWALLLLGLGLFPIAILREPNWAKWQAVLPILLLSAVFEAGYYLTLMRAYQQGDFSLVYPIARGTAPLWISLWAVIFLHEQISLLGAAGIFLIVVGLVAIGKGSQTANSSVKISWQSILLALLVALFISFYSSLDAFAVKQIDPMAYTIAVLCIGGFLVFPLLVWQVGLEKSWQCLRADWRKILLVGVLTITAYGLTLFVYRVGKLSYAGAVREISIVMAVGFGWQFLGERITRLRLFGVLLVFGGVVWLATLG